MSIFDHPGNLGPTRGSLLTVHHADWPAYPNGNDFWESLLQLPAFPEGTDFIEIDDIDRSILFVADVHPDMPTDQFDSRNFHIAVWYQDLLDLAVREFLVGIEEVTERSGEKIRWKKLLSKVPPGAELGFQTSDGQFIPIEAPDFEIFEDDEESAGYVTCPTGKIKTTELGRRALSDELKKASVEFNRRLSKRVMELYGLGYYDTCIREACVHLEDEIRRYVGSSAWGQQLIRSFIGKVGAEKKLLASHVRNLGQELRALFKFTRNDIMHSLRDVDEASAISVLFRVAGIRSALNGDSE